MHFYSLREKGNNLIDNPWIKALTTNTHEIKGYFMIPRKGSFSTPAWDVLAKEYIPHYVPKSKIFLYIVHPNYFRSIEGFLITYNHELGHALQHKEGLVDYENRSKLERCLSEISVERASLWFLEKHFAGQSDLHTFQFRSLSYIKGFHGKLREINSFIPANELAVTLENLIDRTFNLIQEYWRNKI